MPLSHAEFYALPEGAEIDAMKKRFIVDGREMIGEVDQPVLVDAATGQPLFGAIYITHLMSLVKQQNLPAATEFNDPVATEYHANEALGADHDPIEDVELYCESTGVPVLSELALNPESLHAQRRQHPLNDEYHNDLYAA